MANLFVTREVCPTCNGEKCIVCCSCSTDEDCQTLVCPTCKGTGKLVSYNTSAIVAAVCAVVCVVVAAILVLNFAG